MFENRRIKVGRLGGEEIYMSRIIASWLNKGGIIDDRRWGTTKFAKWCRALEISEEDIHDMVMLVTNGKLELEIMARAFLKEEKGETSE